MRSGMEYIYFGLISQLIQVLKRFPPTDAANVDSLQISLNVDGLPLFKSSGKCVWPVLCAVMNLKPVTVFPVALTYGNAKPDNLQFLQDTVRDLCNLIHNGLQVGDKVIQVILKGIICDAPAKAFVKATKLCSGYFGCDKCSQRGFWQGRITYPDVVNLQARTDESFRSQVQEEHHRGVSPFLDLPVDMVKQFPIDYMHQVCLGVMKKILISWMRGKRDIRMSVLQIEQISSRLLDLKQCVPSTFARKPRSLKEVDRWKATEYRQFLLYTGKIVLKGILRSDLYDHFMIFSVAISILASPQLVQRYREYAHNLLVYFVSQCSHLYGDEFLVYNVHSMVHLAADVEELGSLDQYNAFMFENYLQHLKKLVRSGRNPIVQIAKRMGEAVNTKITQHPEVTQISMKKT